MVTFAQSSNPNLFIAQDTSPWVALYVANPAKQSYDLSDALATGDASFVFASGATSTVSANGKAVVGLVTAALQPLAYDRIVCWLTDPVNFSSGSIAFMQLAEPQGAVTVMAQLNASLAGTQLTVVVPAGTTITVDEQTGSFLVFTPTAGAQALQFSGSAAPSVVSMSGAVLIACSGAAAGCLTLASPNAFFIQRSDLLTGAGAPGGPKLSCGFQVLCPDPSELVQQHFDWQFYPLADPNAPNGADMIGLTPTIDPSDPTGQRTPARTQFAFTGQNQDTSTTVLSSYYRTAKGDPILLTPVGTPAAGVTPATLTITYAAAISGVPTGFAMAPAGDFVLGGSDQLMCGLLPTETISFNQGDRLRFTAYQQACLASQYPPLPASTLAQPVDPTAPLLTTQFVTSWASLIPAAAANAYSSQSAGFPLFGLDGVVNQAEKGLLGPVPTGLAMAAGESFPLLPYGGAVSGSTPLNFPPAMMSGIEATVIAPTRRNAITPPAAGQGGAFSYVTTPAGFVVLLQQLATGVIWRAIDLALGSDADGNPTYRMRFVNPDAVLQQAFQAPQLFIVATNPAHLGTLTGPSTASGPPQNTTPQFQNGISVADWEITAEVGSGNNYADYNNIVIIKSFSGSVAQLVANPAQWTLPTQFSVPAGGSMLDLTALSQWMQNYIATAAADQSGNFDAFNQVVNDPEWNGILVLKPSLTQLPDTIEGLLSSMPKSGQYAHHFGVNFNQIGITAPTLGFNTPSSMFMLVDYIAQGYVPPPAGATPPPMPVTVSAFAPYGFILMTLICKFVNSTVQNFVSYAQLTLGEFFSDPVLRMAGANANDYDSIVLTGVYQNNNGQNLFLLDSTADNLFMMDSNVINKVEVSKALFTTVDPSTNRFDLWGYLDFGLLPIADANNQPYDLFGYGSPAGEAEMPRQGLYFSGLGIVMTTSDSATTFTFDTSKIAFDPRQSSQPREDSLAREFALQLQSLIVSAPQQTPASLNYLSLLTWANLGEPKLHSPGLSGVSDSWYGLNFNINLGTLGVLANKAGFNSSMLLAWSPGNGATSTQRAVAIGLLLPGVTPNAPAFSLEGVLKLAIGSLNLTFTPANGGTPAYWLLNIDNIALKFLGFLSLPPTGVIDFALFGDNQVTSASSLGWYAIYNKLKSDGVDAARSKQIAGRRAQIEGPKS
jgi:hypothetical protein